MNLKPSAASKGVIGIAGHAGIGHAFSHSGFFQEDSGGFAYLTTLLCRTCPAADITIASVDIDEEGRVVVTTKGGGVGRASALHGFSPYEKELMQRAVGMRCAAPQTLSGRIFGRTYGQGAGTQASAFSLAAANAMMDTVRVQWPSRTIGAPDDLPGCAGSFLGGVLDIDDMPVSWLLTINASENGTGPNEDSEGCVPIGNKGRIMQELGMLDMPLLVLEGKAYVPALQPPLEENSIFIRWNSKYDNIVSGECLVRAAKETGQPVCVLPDTYSRYTTELADETRRIGERIEALGHAYASETNAARKIALIAELATICNHDSAGSIFMTNDIQRIVGNGGLWPGLGAMLALIVTREEADLWKTLRLTDEEMNMVVDILVKAAQYLYERKDEAMVYVEQRRPEISLAELEAMARS